MRTTSDNADSGLRTILGWFGMIMLAGLLYGCSSGKFQTHPKKPDSVKVKDALAHHEEDLQGKKLLKARRFVTIDGGDIQLPLTTTQSELPDPRTYSFFVWAYDDEESAGEMLQTNLFVDVMGCKASIQPVRYANSNLPTNAPSGESRTLVEVQVTSQDVKDTQGFEILAWFPKKFARWETQHRAELENLRRQIEDCRKPGGKSGFALTNLIEKAEVELHTENPYSARRTVRVYNGDLRTRIYMASEDEVRQSFGPQFAKYFYVGRVYLRNRHPEKSMVVYTTSLRAQTLMYRAPDLEAARVWSQHQDGQRLELLDRQLEMHLATGVAGTNGKALHWNQASKILDTTMRLKNDASVDEIIKESGVQLAAGDVRQTNEAHQLIVDAKAQYDRTWTELTKSPDAFITNWSNLKPQERSRELAEVQGAFQSDPAAALTSPNPNVRKFAEAVRGNQEEFKKDQKRQYAVGTPMDFPVPLTVLPSQRPLAFSEDARSELRHAAHGFIWRDYYRPMTFQTVLNSLIFATENSTRAYIVQFLRSAGLVAGGVAGLGGIFNEFTTRGYAESVAFSTAIVIPEVSKLLLDDLNKYIRNLGDLGMDTVVVVPANSVVDKYIFFPRGPILYGVDEFCLNQPSFIVQVDSTDVAVEATLIEKGKTLETGLRSSSDLVGEALNEGKSQRDAEDTQMVQMHENLRLLRLSSLPGEVEKMIKDHNTNGAVQLIQSFQVGFGQDKSGVVDKLIAKYNLPILTANRAPTMSSISDIGLEDGGTATVFFKVNDEETPREKLKVWVMGSTNTALLPTNNIVLTGTNGDWTARLQCVAQVAGDTEVTLAVSDGEASVQKSFGVHVRPRPVPLELRVQPQSLVMGTNLLSADLKITARSILTNSPLLKITGDTNVIRNLAFKGGTNSLTNVPPVTFTLPGNGTTNELTLNVTVTNLSQSALSLELRSDSQSITNTVTLKKSE